MKKLSLVNLIFISMLIGVVCGVVVNQDVQNFSWIVPIADFVSDIFLRLLQMVIVPLVVTSITTGILSLGSSDRLGRVGLSAIVYYVSTSLLAISLGLIIVNAIKPGIGVDLGLQEQVSMTSGSLKDVIEIFVRMVPVNFLDVASKGQMLPIIFFCVLFGLFVTQIEKKYRESLTTLLKALFEVMMKMTHAVLYLAPIGIWGLITKLVANTGFNAFVPLAWYALCVILALFIHAVIILPLIITFTTKRNPFVFMGKMKLALITAFSTSSSSATLPVTIRSLEKNALVSNKISGFVLPLGATINMDGTALYECIAVMFIAQAYGIDLNLSQQFIVILTALLASIGAAGIPMAGLVMMSIVLNAVGLPLEGVGLIIAVDRILDMCRTTVNVWSDSCGGFIIGHLQGEIESN